MARLGRIMIVIGSVGKMLRVVSLLDLIVLFPSRMTRYLLSFECEPYIFMKVFKSSKKVYSSLYAL